MNFQPGDLTPSGIKNTRSQLARGDSCYLGNWQVTKPSVLYLEGAFYKPSHDNKGVALCVHPTVERLAII